MSEQRPVKVYYNSACPVLEGVPAHVDGNAGARDLAQNVDGVADLHHMHVWSLEGRASWPRCTYPFFSRAIPLRSPPRGQVAAGQSAPHRPRDSGDRDREELSGRDEGGAIAWDGLRAGAPF